MCFLVLGDHKVNLSLIHSLPQVVEAGTICYVIFSQYQSLHPSSGITSEVETLNAGMIPIPVT